MNVAYDLLIESLRKESDSIAADGSVRTVSAKGAENSDSAVNRDAKVAANSPDLLTAALGIGSGSARAWYDLTPFRRAIVDAFDLPSQGCVLEIGAGSGTLTAALAERVGKVVALESSEHYGALLAHRCSSLANVEVSRTPLSEYAPRELFDLVVCVDPQVSTEDRLDPVAFLLSRARDVLKATGTLVLSVSNPVQSHGAFAVEDGYGHVRGASLPLEPLKSLAREIGFRELEIFPTFPHSTAPLMIVEPARASEQGVPWARHIPELYRGSKATLEQLQSWWSGVADQGLTTQFAPGWVVLAHMHRVHHKMWSGWGLKRFSTSARIPEQAGRANEALERIPCSNVDVAEAAQLAARPHVTSLVELKGALAIAQERIEELSAREADIVRTFSETESMLRRELGKAWDDSTEKDDQIVRVLETSKRLEGRVVSGLAEIENLTIKNFELERKVRVYERTIGELEETSVALEARCERAEADRTALYERLVSAERGLEELRTPWYRRVLARRTRKSKR